jgi:1-acyl-sn-glycerol-3-phosphate acyltransferase
MAIRGQAPIVPVAITGTRNAMRKGSPIIYPVTVHVRFGTPVETAGLTLEDRDRIIAEVRARVEAMLGS